MGLLEGLLRNGWHLLPGGVKSDMGSDEASGQDSRDGKKGDLCKEKIGTHALTEEEGEPASNDRQFVLIDLPEKTTDLAHRPSFRGVMAIAIALARPE